MAGRGFFAFSKTQNAHAELVGSWRVTGDRVTGTVLVTANDFVMLNVGAVQHQYEFVVQGSKITSWTMTPSEQARVGAAAQAYKEPPFFFTSLGPRRCQLPNLTHV